MKYGTLILGNCYVCNKEIDSKHFECGHVVARKKGGEDKLDNLRPICEECNKSMGTQNLQEFKNYFLGMIVNKNHILKKNYIKKNFLDKLTKSQLFYLYFKFIGSDLFKLSNISKEIIYIDSMLNSLNNLTLQELIDKLSIIETCEIYDFILNINSKEYIVLCFRYSQPYNSPIHCYYVDKKPFLENTDNNFFILKSEAVIHLNLKYKDNLIFDGNLYCEKCESIHRIFFAYNPFYKFYFFDFEY